MFKGAVAMSNVIKHLQGMHRGTPLTRKHNEQKSAPSGGGKRRAEGGEALAIVDAEASCSFSCDEIRDGLMKIVLLDAQPPSFVQHKGFQGFYEEFLRPRAPPLISRQTLVRHLEKRKHDMVDVPRDAALASFMKPMKVSFGPLALWLSPLLSFASDGWKGGSNKYHSFAVSGPELQGEMVIVRGQMAPRTALLPRSVLVKLRHQTELMLDASAQARVFAEVLASINVPATGLLTCRMDTTALQPLTLEMSALAGLGLVDPNIDVADTPAARKSRNFLVFGACSQHQASLIVHDMSKDSKVFAEVMGHVRSLSAWTRASHKKMELLIMAQRDPEVAEAMRKEGAKRLPLRPLKAADHRFSLDILMVRLAA